MSDNLFTKSLSIIDGFLLGRVALFIIFSTLVAIPASHAGQVVGGAVKNPAGVVAATPISIPRPIQLEKIPQLATDNTTSLTSLNESLERCEIVSIQGNELALRLHYRVNPNRVQPIYAGAWLYDANKQAIDAGYKPVALGAFPGGSIDVTLVLPQEGFRSDYLVAFLMESGQPVFLNGRFKMPYQWENGTLAVTNEVQSLKKDAAATPALQDKQQFCEDYANTALAQYNFARANNLPDIVPPVWSNDYAQHYNWCLGVSQENANQGTALRQGQLEQYKNVRQANPQPGSSLGKTKGAASVESTPVQQMPMHQTTVPGQQIQLNPVGQAAAGSRVAPLHPGQKKGFDPGRGP